MFIVPELGECIEFAKLIGCNNIIEVPIEPREFDLPYRCHHNCSYNPLLGYYFLKCKAIYLIYVSFLKSISELKYL